MKVLGYGFIVMLLIGMPFSGVLIPFVHPNIKISTYPFLPERL